jgi:hypothetical protein
VSPYNCKHGVLQHYLFYLRLAGEQGSCEVLYEFSQQQTRGFVEALKTPGNWRQRARDCARSTAEPEG